MANGLYAAIAQGGQPIQIENPLNQMAKLAALQNAQQEQQLNALKMQEYQRGVAEEEELRNYLRGVSDLTSPDVRTNLLKYGTKGVAASKVLSEQATAELNRQKTQAELTKSRLEQSRDMLAGVTTPDEYMQWHLANHADPILGPMLKARGITAEASQARINEALKQPGGLQALINESKLGVEKFMQLNAPKLTTQEFGGGTRVISTPGLGGAATEVAGSRIAKTLTPEQAREAGQESKVIARTETDAAGNVTAFNKFGQIIQITDTQGKPVAVKGKPSATFEKTQAQREQLTKDINTAIFELKDAVKPKGLIDQSTGSGVGRLTDIAARSVGIATEGDIAISKLKPIADLVLKMVPRFEGPQSDKDTQSYKEAAGQLADPGMPREIRKAAANTIIRLMENRKGQFVTTDMAAEGTTARGAGATMAPMYARNPSTGERIMSLDGGNTWNPAR